MKAIDNKELILALEELEKEKGIKKDYLLESIETALVTAYKRNFDALENVKVDIDHKTGATHIYSVKEIVENKRFNLLEALAENIASEVLEKFDLIKGIMVRVKKPEAPVPGIYDYFGVEIKRTKDE